MKTKEKIIQKALELFNENGIEYVGMRELAASIDMQIGNITYYFPTKNDIVNQLALDLSDLNTKTLIPPDYLTMQSFLEMRRRTFENQYKYRCLFLSFVHLIKQNLAIAERYKKVEKERENNLLNNITLLQKGHYLKVISQEDIDFLGAAIALIARFWISEASISYDHMSVENKIHHYTKLIAQMLIPYATRKGRMQIDDFLNK